MGIIQRIAGPLVVASGMTGANMYDVVRVGNARLIGEIIQLNGDNAVIQVYEDTSGTRPSEPVISQNAPLSVELGPGLISNIFDGVQRPLDAIKAKSGIFITKGIEVPSLDRKRKWHFVVEKGIAKGSRVEPGTILGHVQETDLIKHYIMVPDEISGTIEKIRDGNYTLDDKIATVRTKSKPVDLTMLQKRPVRLAAKSRSRLNTDAPLVTGQRVVDVFFPVAKGGAAAVPGPFGAGKTVIQHQLAKYSDADVIVYAGCGERGNEMTEVLTEFPELTDPRTGKPLMQRTILIANTSNMPVAAREASIYTSIAIAEYFRDMGYSVAVMADSTSRWAEAMREIAARLEEMPGEEGYPAYLPKRIAEFYERAGKVITLNGRQGAITVIGAVSPPGGDISEPVSQGTLRVVKTFWSLDAALAASRHFPSINWLTSYSLYLDELEKWYKANAGEAFIQDRVQAMKILQREAELKDIVQLVGADALPDSEKVTLEAGRMLREDFMRQSAFDEIDAYTGMKKQSLMLGTILYFNKRATEAAAAGVAGEKILKLESRNKIARMREIKEDDADKDIASIHKQITQEFDLLIKEEGRAQ